MSRIVKARRVDDLHDCDDPQPGDFKYWRTSETDPAGLHFRCPCGCGGIWGASFIPPRPQWTFDGNLDKPTVSPSLRTFAHDQPGQVTHWHGFLQEGEFRPCSDSPN